MRTTPTIVAIALLSGCATSQELIETGERFEHRLQRPPALATACMSRNLERVRGVNAAAAVTIRPLDSGGSELVIPTTLVAHAEAADGGSRVTFWLRPEWFVGRREMIPGLINGC